MNRTSPPELFTWEFATDPYPAYAWLREHSPVHRTTLPSGVEAWLVTRYADARQALADSRLSKNPAHHAKDAQGKSKTGIPGERSANLMTHLLNIDPPDHTRLRRLVSKAFTPRTIAAFAPRVQELADRLIDDFAENGEADLIHDFAFPLPIYAICDLLGVPEEDQDDFRDWAGMMIRHGGGPRGGVARSVKKIRAYLAELIHRKRENPGDDLISALIRASDHGEHLTENEAAAMCFVILFAGFETTINLIGNSAHAFFRNPAQRAVFQCAVERGTTASWTPPSRSCCASTARWSWPPGATPRSRSTSEEHRSVRAIPCSWFSRRPTAIRPGSTSRTRSICPVGTTSTSDTGMASTTAWGHLSHGLRVAPRWRPCSVACPTFSRPWNPVTFDGGAASSCAASARSRWSSRR